MDRLLRVGLVGTAYWGAHLARTFGTLPEARLTALCDLDAKRLDDLGRQHPGVRLVPDLAHLLSLDDGVDPLTRAARDFVACVLKGREPLSSGVSALRGLEVLERAERGATRGGIHR